MTNILEVQVIRRSECGTMKESAHEADRIA